MTKAAAPDENDRVRQGSLPPDPFADADPVRADGKPPLRWRTYGEILAATKEKPREWLVPDLVPFGALTQFVGVAKRGGKSTFVWAMIACAENGRAFLGHRLTATSAVILSEEGDHDLGDKIQAFGMEPSKGVVLSRGVLTGVPEWAELVREGTALALARGHRVLVIDTFAFWAALEGASENDAGTVVAALRPLQEAADQGLAVLLIHHTGKAKDREGGIAARGSSAIAGTVEATIEVRNEGSEQHPNRRVLHVESRTVGVRDVMVELVLMAGEPARFDLVGDAKKVTRSEIEDFVVAWLHEHPGRWFRADDIVEGMKKRGGDVRSALPALVGQQRIARSGAGERGNPFLYATLGTPTPPPSEAAKAADQDSVPSSSQGVPRNSTAAAPHAPDVSVPAVPAPSMGAERGTQTAARGKDDNAQRCREERGNSNGVPVGAPSEATGAPPPAPPQGQGRLDLDPIGWREERL